MVSEKWHDQSSHFLMCRLDDVIGKQSLLIILNANKHPINIHLPAAKLNWQLEISSELSPKINHLDHTIDVSAQ